MEMERLLNFSCELGRQLLENGAEIYRVEESIQFLLNAYGWERTEVFAIPAVIVLNVEADGKNYNKSVRIRTSSLNLHRLQRLNALCRDLCRETPELDEAERRFQAILAEPRYSLAASRLGYSLVALFFTLFWGGTALDALVACVGGLIVQLVVSFMNRVQANIFFTNVVTSMLLAIPPQVLELLGAPIHMDKIIIGTIMLLVPGIAITNVMRDVLAGDFVTALTRFAEVLIVAMGISIGIAITLTGSRALLGWL